MAGENTRNYRLWSTASINPSTGPLTYVMDMQNEPTDITGLKSVHIHFHMIPTGSTYPAFGYISSGSNQCGPNVNKASDVTEWIPTLNAQTGVTGSSTQTASGGPDQFVTVTNWRYRWCCLTVYPHATLSGSLNAYVNIVNT